MKTATNGQKPEKYLILTSSGGGGHINAAQARKAELIKLGVSDEQIDIIDLMGLASGIANKDMPWVPTYSFFGLDPVFSGKANTEKWNDSQKAGTEEAVRTLENLVEMQPIAERLQAEDVERNLSIYLAENNVKGLFNTQALSTPAICQAVVNHNQNNPSNQLEIITTVTDLITHRAEHFLNSLKNLTDEHKKVLKMEIATSPMTDPGENRKEFLKKYSISNELFVPKAQILKDSYNNIRRNTDNDNKNEYKLPVKDEYNIFPVEKKNKIIIKAGDDSEKRYLESQLNGAKFTSDEKNITIDKKENDKLITITMGSQGSNSVIEYMDAFKDQVNSLGENGDVYLCIAAGKSGAGSLYEKTKSKAEEIIKDLSPEKQKRVKILPLAFQDAQHMASLLNNSDVLITRSGGMSAMEALATNGRNPNRQVYVHSEAKLKYPDNFPKHSYDAIYEALMTGTVKWEGGNAEYLLREIGASLGSPETVNFGFEEQEQVNHKENSLFHFAYDGKLNKNNLAKIEQLIREGSNPNLRFPGGSYLIDHCTDYDTKMLLASYGANLTKKALEKLTEPEVISIKAILKNYKNNGSPKNPTKYDRVIDKEKEEKAKLYLNPKVVVNSIEKIILGIDAVGNFIKNKVLRMDSIRNSIDATKMYLRTDPTEKRNIYKRVRQFRNFLFDATIFIAKQPVNMITKPIAMTTNIIKYGLLGVSMLYNGAKGQKSNISNYNEIKEAGKKISKDLKDSLVAWGAAALVMSGFGVPISFAIGGTSASISLGVANFGPGSSIVSSMNQSLVSGVASLGTPAANAILTAEGIVEWGMIRPYAYFALDPKKIYYENKQGFKHDKLNVVGEKIHKLHETTSDLNISIEVRKQAKEEMEKMLKNVAIHEVAAPVLQKGLVPLKEGKNSSRKTATH